MNHVMSEKKKKKKKEIVKFFLLEFDKACLPFLNSE